MYAVALTGKMVIMLSANMLRHFLQKTMSLRTKAVTQPILFAPTAGLAPINSGRLQAASSSAVCNRRRRVHSSFATAMCLDPPQNSGRSKLKDFTSRDYATTIVTDDDLPDVKEEDIEEQFVRGSGPGGQKINKTAVCVVLKHKPSGMIVRCQETRSQMKNRQLARKILQRKLDEVRRGEESLAARELSKARARKARKRRKSIKKHFKSRRDKSLMEDW